MYIYDPRVIINSALHHSNVPVEFGQLSSMDTDKAEAGDSDYRVTYNEDYNDGDKLRERMDKQFSEVRRRLTDVLKVLQWALVTIAVLVTVIICLLAVILVNTEDYSVNGHPDDCIHPDECTTSTSTTSTSVITCSSIISTDIVNQAISIVSESQKAINNILGNTTGMSTETVSDFQKLSSILSSLISSLNSLLNFLITAQSD